MNISEAIDLMNVIKYCDVDEIVKDEFCVSIVRADDSKTSQMLLDELNAELKHMKDDHIKE